MCPGAMTLGPHCDAAYGHAPSCIIVSALLTRAFGTNALIYESSPGSDQCTNQISRCFAPMAWRCISDRATWPTLPRRRGATDSRVDLRTGREDWKAFEGAEGEVLAFPGGLAAHFTSENTTGHTRWSIDARVVTSSSTSAYDAGSYFAVAERVGDAWRRVGEEIDAVDPRVGIPFDRN